MLMIRERRGFDRMGGVSRFPPLHHFSFHLRWSAGGEGAFSPSTANGLGFTDGASGFPAAYVRWVPWIVSGVEVGFENLTFFFSEADMGVIQSFELSFDDILIGCRVRWYRCHIVDANAKTCIASRGCSGGNGSDGTRFIKFGRWM